MYGIGSQRTNETEKDGKHCTMIQVLLNKLNTKDLSVAFCPRNIDEYISGL